MSKSTTGWLLFIVLSLIWGSSFILMKIGLTGLNAYQVASLRVASAGFVLLPFGIAAFKKIEKEKRKFVILSGLLGNLFPAFLYCIAETKIDSSLAAILNALTPLLTIVTGVLFFQMNITFQKIAGVLLGLAGLILLPFATNGALNISALSYAALVLMATICYALNVNMVSRHLKGVAALDIAAFAFSCLFIPAVIILISTGFFSGPFLMQPMLKAATASVVLGVIGTAIANIIFYALVKKEGPLFASLVTYGIPVIAVGWGLYFGEVITLAETGCLIIILLGVYLVNKK